MFNLLADGGVWAIPRSGLVFTRKGDKLVLTEVMPHDPGMPMSAAELLTYQQEDYAENVRQFGLAGITMESEVPQF